MPELPDVTLYVEHLARRLEGGTLIASRVISPNLLRTAAPPLEATHGRRVRGVRRVGKRIAIELEGSLFLVFHLMVGGRFHWRDAGAPLPAGSSRRAAVAPGGARGAASGVAPVPARGAQAGGAADGAPGSAPQRGAQAGGAPASAPERGSRPRHPLGRNGLAAFEFTSGTLTLTEASRKQRASLHVAAGEDQVRALDPGGIEPLTATLAAFHAALTRENHTLKRALTDPRLLSGIGNSYSDEILHRARLSPLLLTRRLEDEAVRRLYAAMREVLFEWTDRLRIHYGDAFPEKVTAFRPGMAVHGRFKQPCPVCGTPVQRIVYAENETNYCPRCQTGGRLLADRALSRLLHDDWPRTLEQMEG